jgi:hypothetical protein
MRTYTITPAESFGGWRVLCDGQAIGAHFTQGLAVANALNLAQVAASNGAAAVVRLELPDEDPVELAQLAAC